MLHSSFTKVPFLLGLLATCAGGCASEEPDELASDESALSETSAPRVGSSIRSPSVSPDKTYWGSRSVRILTEVGYLNQAESRVALRADGIIANSPPNGRIGVDELAVLESRADTLFPEERAAIPKLWSILEKRPARIVTAGTPTIATTTSSTYATRPFKLPLAELDATTRAVAERIQLTRNDDGDAQTISGLDVEQANADRGSYLPQEAAHFKAIAYRIAEKAPPLLNDMQRVDVETPSRQSAALAQLANVDLVAETTITLTGKYELGSRWPGSIDKPRLVAASTVDARPRAGEAATFKIVHLNAASGEDRLPERTNLQPGRLEIWANGARTAEVELAKAPDAVLPIPFGYAVTIDGTKHELGCPKSGPCAYDAPMIGALVYARSYRVAGSPDTTVDLFPNGRALIKENGVVQECTPLTRKTVPGTPAWHAIDSCNVDLPSRAIRKIVLGGADGLGRLQDGATRTRDLYPL